MRILGGHDEERAGQRMGLSVRSHLSLFHCFKQSTLGLRSGSVDLIGKHQVREDRTRMEAERVLAPVVNGYTGNVRRKQITGELYALIAQTHHPGQRMGQRGFAHAGYVLDKQVPTGQHARNTQADLDGLPQDDAVQGFDSGVKLFQMGR